MAVPETKDDYKGRSFPLPRGNQIAAFIFGPFPTRMLGAGASQISMAAAWDGWLAHGPSQGLDKSPAVL